MADSDFQVTYPLQVSIAFVVETSLGINKARAAVLMGHKTGPLRQTVLMVRGVYAYVRYRNGRKQGTAIRLYLVVMAAGRRFFYLASRS